jgi:small subunit ribosomal protein S6
MPLYEHVFVTRRDISSQQVDNLTETLTGIIKDGGGNVTKTEYWGLRNLAYRIKKNRKGHYVLMNIDSPYPAVAEMERVLRLNEDVIRTMILRVDELEEGPSAVMLQKTSRDDRGRRDGGRRPPPRGNSETESGKPSAAAQTATNKETKGKDTPAAAETETTKGNNKGEVVTDE